MSFLNANLVAHFGLIFIIFNMLVLSAAFMVWMERKVCAYIQDRVGPNRVGYEEGFVFGGGSAVIAPDGAELLVADPLEPEELTAKLDAGALRRARVANPAHGIERHELLIEALARAARPREASEGIAGDREEARP